MRYQIQPNYEQGEVKKSWLIIDRITKQNIAIAIPCVGLFPDQVRRNAEIMCNALNNNIATIKTEISEQ
jgi:hypothetical protein